MLVDLDACNAGSQLQSQSELSAESAWLMSVPPWSPNAGRVRFT